jgi:hypothetical protein
MYILTIKGQLQYSETVGHKDPEVNLKLFIYCKGRRK